MPETPPPGIKPLFLRGVTCEKYGLKTGEGAQDYVDYKFLKKEEILAEVIKMGVMSDFGESKKEIEKYPGDQILFVVDRESKYGEAILMCYTEEAKEEFLKGILERQEALQEQIRAELEAEEARKAAEYARQNVVYEDVPVTARPWVSATSADTDAEIKSLGMGGGSNRELISIEVSRPKRLTKQSYKFFDKNADNVMKIQAVKDPNFKGIRESEFGCQVAPVCTDADAQTTWYRSVNKAVQYEAASVQAEAATDPEQLESLLVFLEKSVTKIEHALQQNESVDIFHDTFRLMGDDDANEGVQAENELRELKNFADPTYSKSKALSAIDWMPKNSGLVAVSAVRNISFDQRIPIFGQTHTSYVLLWDFRLLVKPLILMRSNHEVFTFRFNRVNPMLVAGGTITGQVVLWDIADAFNAALRKNNRGSAAGSAAGTSGGGVAGGNGATQEEEEINSLPVAPKFVSSVDHSHKKCVADLFWLPPTTQINYRGQLVGDEHLDGNSYQFVTVAGDGMIMVWDIRYEAICNDELRHVGRAKHAVYEKTGSKDTAGQKPLWTPIFKAHLKRLEGVGELSLCKVCETANAADSSRVTATPFAGDNRSQFTIATEEGDVIFADLSARRSDNAGNSGKKEVEAEEDDEESEFSCVKWIAVDHPRPSVCLMESPFFPQVLLSVSDWGFHIWKTGESKPLFTSPISSTYLTAGCWSLTRPSVLFVACADGQILAWDFTDTSFKASIELKATHSKITSMEFLSSSNSKHQLLAVGDEQGTLHIFEVPRNLTRPVHKEESIMLKFLEREIEREDALKSIEPETAEEEEDAMMNNNANNNASSGNNNAGGSSSHADKRAATSGSADLGALGLDGNAQDEAARLAKERLAKEEEEFLKLEAAFINELGLSGDQLPSFLSQ